MNELMTIGEVVRRTGKPASAIRYYESIGLMPEPLRISGRRQYEEGALRTLAVIETGQRAGLSLDEIKLLLDASPGDAAAIDRLREVAERRLPEVIAHLEQTQFVRRWLEQAVLCQCPSLDDCPLFEPDPQPCDASGSPPTSSARPSAR